MDTTLLVESANRFSNDVLNFHRQLVIFRHSKGGLIFTVLLAALSLVDIVSHYRLSNMTSTYLLGYQLPSIIVNSIMIISLLNVSLASFHYVKLCFMSRNISLSPSQKKMYDIDSAMSKSLSMDTTRHSMSFASSTAMKSYSELPGRSVPPAKLNFVNRKYATATYPSATTIMARNAFHRALNTLRKAQVQNPMKDRCFIRSKEQMRLEWARRAKLATHHHWRRHNIHEDSQDSNLASSLSNQSGHTSWKLANSWIFAEAQKSRQWVSSGESSFLNGSNARDSVEKCNFAAYIATQPSLAKAPQRVVKPCPVDSTLEMFKLNKSRLDKMVENLRLWMSATILKPLVEEIDRANGKLAELSKSAKIGESSIATLQGLLIAQGDHLNTLPTILRYLELSTNQEYVVRRIRQLAKDGVIREFKWKSGGGSAGKAWDEHLPTDTEILFHLFCTFVDNHLPANPLCMDGRTFSTEHCSRAPSIPQPGTSALCIHRATLNPPHYQVLIDNQWHDMGKGKQNFFHTLILFIKAIKMNRGGFLEELNFGPSGLNLLWVLE